MPFDAGARPRPYLAEPSLILYGAAPNYPPPSRPRSGAHCGGAVSLLALATEPSRPRPPDRPPGRSYSPAVTGPLTGRPTRDAQALQHERARTNLRQA